MLHSNAQLRLIVLFFNSLPLVILKLYEYYQASIHVQLNKTNLITLTNIQYTDLLFIT